MGYIILDKHKIDGQNILFTDEECPEIMYLSLPDTNYMVKHDITNRDDMPDHRWLHISIGFN